MASGKVEWFNRSTRVEPIFEDSGPKKSCLNGFWHQSPLKLGTWTLWGGLVVLAEILGCVKWPGEAARSHIRVSKSKENLI